MKKTGFKMKGYKYPGISPLKNGQKTKRKLKKKHGPYPEHDQDGDGIPDTLQVDSKNVSVEKPDKAGRSTEPKKRKTQKSEPGYPNQKDPVEKKKKRKRFQNF